ncbi:MAG TPA: hypothetical protein VH207_14180 [Chthoniobacterales bacterium]|jgi:hypothetical protein|nr:hypothetical protein [Chthoniobacterales bacterium]
MRFFLLLGISFALSSNSGGLDYQPKIAPANFQPGVDHRYFPLRPGTRRRYAATIFGEKFEREIVVARATKTILGVRCTVVHDLTTSKGKLGEDTYDYYAQDKEGNVWYFGEATTEMRPLGPSSAGSWEAGLKGALPGIVMPAQVKPGPAFRQDYLANWVEEMGQIMALGETVQVPAGTFPDCIRIREWSLLESGTETRWYAPGIGFVRSEMLGEIVLLVSVGHE